MKLINGIELAQMGHRFTIPVQVLLNASKVIEGFNIKKKRSKRVPFHGMSFIEYH